MTQSTPDLFRLASPGAPVYIAELLAAPSGTSSDQRFLPPRALVPSALLVTSQQGLAEKDGTIGQLMKKIKR